MMGTRGMLKGGNEWDALTGWRRKLALKHKHIRAAKRSFNKRMRREARQGLRVQTTAAYSP